MSELYKHLERLQGRPQQILDQGVPIPMSTQTVAASRGAQRSKRVLLAIPLAAVTLGLITVAAVVIIKPHLREAPRPRSETTVSALNYERQSVPKMPTHLEALSLQPNFGAPGKAPDETEKGVKDELALKTMTTSIDSPREDATPGMPTSQPTSELPVPHRAAAAKAEELCGPVGEPKAKAHNEQEKTVVPQEAEPKHSSKRSAEEVFVPESADVSRHHSAGGSRTVSREEPPAPAVEQALQKKPSGDQGGEGLRYVLIIAEEARRMGNWEDAERGYREYLAQKSDPDVMNNLGAVLLAQGRYAEAEQVLLQARGRSSDPDIAANLAAAYWFQGKKEAACRLVFSFQKEGYMALTERTLGFLLEQCEPGRHIPP